MLQMTQEPHFSEPVSINISDIENIYGRNLPIAVKLNSLWVSTISRASGITLRDRCSRTIQLKSNTSLSFIKPGCRVNVTATLYPHDNSRIFLERPEDLELVSHSYIKNLRPCHLSSIGTENTVVGFELEDLPMPIAPEGILLFLDGISCDISIEEKRVHSSSPLVPSMGIHSIRAEIKQKNLPTLIKEWNFTVYDVHKEMNVYLGIPHTHTSYSDGEGTPSAACIHAIKNGLDYMFITDHSHKLDGVVQGCYEYSRELGEYVELSGSQWFKTRKQLEEITSLHSDFIALRGFEMSCSLGHINVLNTSSYIEGNVRMKKTEEVLKWLMLQKGAIASINHPEDASALFSGSLAPLQQDLDEHLCLIEVGNGTPERGYVRYERVLYEGLDRGWHWGVLNSQDNHADDWGDHTNLTGILAEDLTEESLLSALKSRNTYSTETGTLRLLFSAGGLPMGSLIELNEGSRLIFDVSAQDERYPIRKLELISNGGQVIDEKYFPDLQAVKWNPQVRVQNSEKWFLIKVVHSNDAWGISSPIFIKPTN